MKDRQVLKNSTLIKLAVYYIAEGVAVTCLREFKDYPVIEEFERIRRVYRALIETFDKIPADINNTPNLAESIRLRYSRLVTSIKMQMDDYVLRESIRQDLKKSKSRSN